MNKKSILTIISFLFITISSVFAQTTVEAVVDADSYEINKLITVSVSVKNNTGLHGIYFEMDYDSELFQFESMEDSNLSRGFPKGELLYAVNPYSGNKTVHPHIVVSYTVKGNDVEIKNNGLLMKMRFRVKKQGIDKTESFRFNFTNNGVINGAAGVVDNDNWISSSYFQIESPYQGAYISIEEPYYYQVFNKSDLIVETVDDKEIISCNVDTVFTTGNYLVKIYNKNQNVVDVDFKSVTNGYLFDTPVVVEEGANTIIAELYTEDKDPIYSTSSVVYLAKETEFINIVSPQDHAFINSDMTVIEVETPYDNVTVNHLPAVLISTKNDINTYKANVWLKKGFNKIVAQAVVGTDKITYSDEIDIFYKKDSEHFNLILPSAEETFKDSMDLVVRGEIGSEYRSDVSAEGAVKNIITIDILFTPDDLTTQSAVKFIDSMSADISRINSIFGSTQSNYIFTNNSTISLDGLNNGTLQVDVYKNRDGNKWDDKLTRICYINNNRLWIDLVQPNVYAEDVLDTFLKIDNFDESQDLNSLYGYGNLSDSVLINREGSLKISSSELLAEEIDSVSGIVDLEETPDGTMYALKNIAGSLTILSKQLKDLEWKEVVTKSGLFGYDIQYTDKGLFIGASNLFSADDDGLYLLEDEKLINVNLPVALPHIQYLNYHDKKLFLYGNYYSSLYSFNIFTLENIENKLQVSGLLNDNFYNNVNIKQFILTDDNSTAILRVENGEILFYRKTENGYNLVNMPDDINKDSTITGNYVVSGEYSSGDYDAYLVLKENPDCEIIMRNRRTGTYFRFQENLFDLLEIDSYTTLYSSFSSDNFHFLYSNGNSYSYAKGQLFFDSLFNKVTKELRELPLDEEAGTGNLLVASGDSIYFNFGQNDNQTVHSGNLGVFYNRYNSSSECEFNYINDDIDCITGFSFEVDPVWINTISDTTDISPVSFGFSLMDENGRISGYSIDKVQLNKFIQSGNDNFSVSASLNTSKQNGKVYNRYIIDVDFKIIPENSRFINFSLGFESVGNNSPEIHNISVKKKVPVELTIDRETSGNSMVLPIHGYIYDKTVKEVFIQEKPVKLEWDGSFFYNYEVQSANDEISVDINCINGVDDEARADFTVKIKESLVELGGVEFYSSNDSDTELISSNGKYTVDKPFIYVSGNFVGLQGVVTGYKTYTTDTLNPQLLATGIFPDNTSGNTKDVYDSFKIDDPGSGYKAGIFGKCVVPLAPGEQKVVIYCENPGGARREFVLGDNYPVINYNMPENEQEITFFMDGDINDTNSSIPIVKTVSISAFENGGNPNYTFTRDYTISGKVVTLYNTNLIVKSLTSGVKFSNGKDQITIELEAGNKFSVPLEITMDSSIEKDFDIAFIPDSPLLTDKRRGVRIHGAKYYENTDFIPDFSQITEDKIIVEGNEPLKIPIKLGFNREDIPLPKYTFIDLTCNYETYISGWIIEDPDNSGLYLVVDEDNNIQYITGLKPLLNRLSWKLQFKDPIHGFVTMSSSSFDNMGMTDYFFNFNALGSSEPTIINFSQALENKFYGTGAPENNIDSLPSLEISRDVNTEFTLMLNNKVVELQDWTGDGNIKTTDYIFNEINLVQGRNTVEIKYTELLKEKETVSYTFLFDNMEPEAIVESYKYDDDNKTLTDVSFYVTEANYSHSYLHIGNNPHSVIPELTILGTETYRLSWRGLSIDTSTNPEVYVEVLDLTGKIQNSFDKVPTLTERERPGDDPVREVDMELPLFNNIPSSIPNESGKQQFTDHTKFAPKQFLNRLNVTQEIADSNGVLIDNNHVQKLLASGDTNPAGDSFGKSVSISGDTIVVGAYRDDENGADSGSVYIFERNQGEAGQWRKTRKLMASGDVNPVGDRFGNSVSISGDTIVVGAYNDEENGAGSGSAYIFERNQGGAGQWGQTRKLMAEGDANPVGDYFGMSVIISGDTIVIGAYNDEENGTGSGSAYIFERNQGGASQWGQTRKLMASGDANPAGDSFGISVSISGDTIVVGACFNEEKGAGSGSAYIFERNQGGAGQWGQTRKLMAEGDSNPAGDNFGISVSISGDTIVVGAYTDDTKGTEAGSVYIYHLEKGLWVEKEKLFGSGSDPEYARFGAYVSISGEYIVVSSHSDNQNGNNSGSAHIFHLEDGSWIEKEKLFGSGSDSTEDQFGTGIAISDDFIVIAAVWDDENGTGSGASYVYPINSIGKDFNNKIDVNTNSCKYMVFKADKQISSFEDFKNNSINFQLYGAVEDLSTMEIDMKELNPGFTLEESSKRYFETTSHYYYIVDMEKLESQFTTSQKLLFPGGAESGKLITDSGSLRIVYDEKLNFNNYPVEIYLTGDLDTQFSDLRFYDPGYEDPSHDPGTENFIKSAIENVNGEYIQKHAGKSENMTLYFWLRPEEEGLGKDSYSLYENTNPYKRVLTLPGIHMGYNNKQFQIYRNGESSPLYSIEEDSIFNFESLAWNHILMEASGENNTFALYLNGAKVDGDLGLTESEIDGILEMEAEYSFGPEYIINPDSASSNKSLYYNAGFYSVARPVYTDKILTENEIKRICFLRNNVESRERTFRFSDGFSDFGDDDYKLRINGDDNSNYFDPNQNAQWKEAKGHGSLKASSEKRNHLRILEVEDDKKYVILDNASMYTRIGVEVTGNSDSFTISPKGESGRYYFGNKNGNNGLKTDKWYSVSGTVDSLEEGKTAKLVLRINNMEQSVDLKKGYFHFIYENQDLEPAEMNLYIDTTGIITLKTDLMFNEGNFVLDNELEETGASTKHTFGRAGTIDFWYKSLIDNIKGEVDYPVVLFDSEYITVGGAPEGDSVSEYYIAIKDGKGLWKTFNTNTKINYGWQYLQVSYDYDKEIVYFYVNGEIAVIVEEDLPDDFGSINGDIPESDNVFIGCDSTRQTFAEGYIDDFYIGKYYSLSKYGNVRDNHRFYSTVYNKTENRIDLDFTDSENSDNYDSVSYRIETIDRNHVLSGETFPVNTADFDGGRYVIDTILWKNGREYLYKDTFNINNKPRFSLIEQTPVVFSGNQDNINFKFAYDRSYQFATENRIFAGIAARISYNGGTETQTRYIVQDFKDQNKLNWLVGKKDETNGGILWETVSSDNGGNIPCIYEDVISSTSINGDFEYFYFESVFEEKDYFPNGGKISSSVEIPVATLNTEIIKADDREYKIDLDLGAPENASRLNTEIIENTEIICTVELLGSEKKKQKSFTLNTNGEISLYYDDILIHENGSPVYGNYKCSIELEYYGITILETNLEDELIWEGIVEEINPEVRELEINEFSLLFNEKIPSTGTSRASFVLKYSAKAIDGIEALLEVIDDAENVVSNIPMVNLIHQADKNIKIFEDIDIPLGNFKVQLTLTAKEFRKTANINIINQTEAPELVLTNGVEAKISYNNVLFTWKGFFDGAFDSEIKYSYQFDNNGWSEANNKWRSVRYFNLKEGYHTFEVKAIYNNKESNLEYQNFFVDINRPVFNGDKISVQEYRNSENVLSAVKVIGDPGAIEDISLGNVFVNNTEIDFDKDNGSFISDKIVLTEDGINEILITAYDGVGNFTEYEDVKIDNTITRIQFPENGRDVKYSPLTIVGTIDKNISADMEIYLLDPFTSDSDDMSSWKKAKINEDRTFFIEDVFVNSGGKNNPIPSTLKIRTEFSTGEVFNRELNVAASEIVMPIEMELSTNAAEGENEDTYVEISCRANVPNISSWSIDYNGDGIYDEIDLVENPDSENAMSHFWSHKYSSLKQFFPRVRIVTVDGNFFSVSDSLIIHEKIKDASPNLVVNPVSVSSVKTELETHKVFILRKENMDNVIDIYFIPRYDSRLLNTGESINLHSLNIEDVDIVRALDEDNLFVVSNRDGVGSVYQITANSFGNYIKGKMLQLSGEICDLTLDEDNLYISFNGSNRFVTAVLNDGILDPDTQKEVYIYTEYTSPIGNMSHLTKDSKGILVSDYINHRIVRVTDNFELEEQFGSLGNKGGEFISPANIVSYGDRIFVYDERRTDIQIFDSEFNEQCTLKFNPEENYNNYVKEGFFNDIADIDILAKEEGDNLYYYALILSKSSGQLAMLRLPHYEELRARVRNNRVVFIKDGEVFTSKPDGSDIIRVLSSDSIPRIEGTLDYPALSPDGRQLVFTSRVKLYNSGYYDTQTDENIYDYDNVYIVDIETQELEKVDLGIINSYAIERPVFNSNGDKLIFSAKEPGEKWGIWVYNTKTGDVDRLFTSDENARFPYYSPDDRYVVFTTDYDGDEDIEIIDTENTSMRTAVTANSARDSMPVWNSVYPDEISNPDYKVESKISFVSEKDSHKGVYMVYISRPDDSDVRIFNIKTKMDGGNPDEAYVEITNSEVEGDYPCFTGDGKSLFFEYFDGSSMALKKYDFTNSVNQSEFLKESPAFIYEDVEILYGARRPAGMKNTITNFTAENKNGDEIVLGWDRYTNTDIFYYVQLMEPVEGGGYNLIEKKVSDQTGTTLKGLDLGADYSVRVCIIENGKEVTTSQWKQVGIPDVIARPSFEIEEAKPYVVQFSGWTPQDTKESLGWEYTWIIDNTPYSAGQSRNFSFEFATSGTKTVQLRVDGSSTTGPDSAISEPFEVRIISDIVPVIEPTVSDDFSTVKLYGGNSLGDKIDMASAIWSVSGTGGQPQQLQGMSREFDISNYKDRVYVTLTLRRIGVNGQNGTDTIEATKVIDLKITEVIPVIDSKVSEANDNVVVFDGSQSIGNINWPNAQWTIFANGMVLHQVNSLSSFSYMFPETNNGTIYSVSLSVPKKSDGTSVTVSKIISIEAAPIEPVIEYKILTYGESGGNISTAKLVLDCTKSLGSNIDFSQAKWTLPLAGKYGDQPTQYGPTAVFSLNNIGSGMVLEANLAMTHKGGTDYKTVTKLISISSDELPVSKIYVNDQDIKETSEGKIIGLDIYKSTGGNINWENTSWIVTVPGSGTMNLRGPAVQVSVPSVSEDGELLYSCTVFRHNGSSQTKEGSVALEAEAIVPRINWDIISDNQKRFYEMNVLETKGSNIDWERTEWYIYDGSDTPVIKRGGSVTHYFPESKDRMGFPILVKMYHKGSTYPFINTRSLDLDGAGAVTPVITHEIASDNPNVYTFSALSTSGSNIMWSRTKWNFGDSSQPAYGGVVEHKFPLDSEGKTYRVTVTLTKVLFQGSTEVPFTTTKEYTIGADEIKAVVKASVVDNFLVLSAGESEGQGLLLDRSVWLFPGEGDGSSVSNHVESGSVTRTKDHLNANSYLRSKMEVSGGFGFPNTFIYAKVVAEGGVGVDSGYSYARDTINPDSDYINKNDAFSSQNSHTGVVCRRSFTDEEDIVVALTVYRQKSDGSVEAETVYVKVNIQEARISANGSGVVYGK